MRPPSENHIVLTLNCGSSSLKFGLFSARGAGLERLIHGEAEAIGTPQARFSATVHAGEPISETVAIATPADAAQRVFALLADRSAPEPSAVGHRIVHGGPSVRRHCVINAEILAELEAAQIFAPLHTPPAIKVLKLAQAHYQAQPHVACLDTAFHFPLPDVARRLPIAAALQADGVERYGFHGLSCESIVHQLGGSIPERLVIAHLGSGSSVTAVLAGRSIDTTMGLTPSGGVMMATRSGDLDPGLLAFLIGRHGLDRDRLEATIDRDAGMKGVSGLSGDMRQLRAAHGDPGATLATRMFVYSVRKAIAGMAAALEGIDQLVFTGGIGENDAETRAEVSAGLSWLAIPHVRVLPAKEDEQIARHALSLERGRR